MQAKFRVDQHCKVLCRIGSLNKAQEKAFKNKIGDEYRVNMCVCACAQLGQHAGREGKVERRWNGREDMAVLMERLAGVPSAGRPPSKRTRASERRRAR